MVRKKSWTDVTREHTLHDVPCDRRQGASPASSTSNILSDRENARLHFHFRSTVFVLICTPSISLSSHHTPTIEKTQMTMEQKTRCDQWDHVAKEAVGKRTEATRNKIAVEEDDCAKSFK